jgi:hypothetical protein
MGMADEAFVHVVDGTFEASTDGFEFVQVSGSPASQIFRFRFSSLPLQPRTPTHIPTHQWMLFVQISKYVSTLGGARHALHTRLYSKCCSCLVPLAPCTLHLPA